MLYSSRIFYQKFNKNKLNFVSIMTLLFLTSCFLFFSPFILYFFCKFFFNYTLDLDWIDIWFSFFQNLTNNFKSSFLITPFDGFFFYFLILLFTSLGLSFFGIKGVFISCFFGIFFFWISQFKFLIYFFIENQQLMLDLDVYPLFTKGMNINLNFCLDFISFSFFFLTTSIGVCATVYAWSYFKNEPHADRFILYLNWFVFSMCFLVISDNCILLYLGWELIGLTSFLLINFWTVRRGTLKCGFKAFIFNKFSDILLIVFISIVTMYTGSTSIKVITYYLLSTNSLSTGILSFSCLCLILCSCIKSAQFLGHLWLPDSMEAPIPASALIHSATLVSAGVYLLLRFLPILDRSNYLLLVGLIGSITAAYGAIVSAAQTDAKKLLAYSTISHCGFLFVTIYIGNIYLAISYLYLHGFYKALTFFCVGNLLKTSRGYQDTRKMGQFAQLLPIESLLLVFCAMNLGGLPYTLGFCYKHLFKAFVLNSYFFVLIAPFIFIGMVCSIIYVFRLVFYSLFDVKKGTESVYLNLTLFYNLKDNYSNTTFASTLFITLLFVLTLFVCENVIFLYIKPDCVDILQNSLDISWFTALKVYSAIAVYMFFYTLFVAIVVILVIVECRFNFNFTNRKQTLISLVLILFVITFSLKTILFLFI